MTRTGTSFQKHTANKSLTMQPLNQPNMQGYVYSVALISTGKDTPSNQQSMFLNLDEVLSLRDKLNKAYPIT